MLNEYVRNGTEKDKMLNENVRNGTEKDKNSKILSVASEVCMLLRNIFRYNPGRGGIPRNAGDRTNRNLSRTGGK